jgi:hypothetical protein
MSGRNLTVSVRKQERSVSVIAVTATENGGRIALHLTVGLGADQTKKQVEGLNQDSDEKTTRL